MGEGALEVVVGRELGIGVAGSLAVLVGRKSKFLIRVKLRLFSVRDHKALV
jgi:hypothetical protein